MRYRVKFRLDGGVFYTEWFPTFLQAEFFTVAANNAGNDVFPLAIEDEDGNVV